MINNYAIHDIYVKENFLWIICYKLRFYIEHIAMLIKRYYVWLYLILTFVNFGNCLKLNENMGIF